MCTTCGCGTGDAHVDGKRLASDPGANAAGHGNEAAPAHESAAPAAEHWHQHADGTWHSHVHGGGSMHGGEPRYVPRPPAPAYAPAPSRIVQIEEDILAKNAGFAAQNRRFFADHGIFALNLVSSPGSGKTTLLVKTIAAWQGHTPVAVIEGDQQTSRDADRVRRAGAHAVQINTGKGCHLDAQMVGHALTNLAPADDSVVLIENVGNLVCPAAFDLGEAHKVVILSVTEGDDKPLKYPDMFRAADLLVINKIDLLPYVEFDVGAAASYARRVQPQLDVLLVSAQTGAGFGEWLAWLEHGARRVRVRREAGVDELRRRVAELEAELEHLRAPAGQV
jgi:hydrogenase nickel incorporation protein HypB